jgi:hypothetical protein
VRKLARQIAIGVASQLLDAPDGGDIAAALTLFHRGFG